MNRDRSCEAGRYSHPFNSSRLCLLCWIVAVLQGQVHSWLRPTTLIHGNHFPDAAMSFPLHVMLQRVGHCRGNLATAGPREAAVAGICGPQFGPGRSINPLRLELWRNVCLTGWLGTQGRGSFATALVGGGLDWLPYPCQQVRQSTCARYQDFYWQALNAKAAFCCCL